jgi:hypothetical protein
MRHWIMLAALSCGSIPAAAAPPAAARAESDSCHGGQCSWSRTLSQTVVRQEPAGILYRLSLLGGSAPEESSRIRWNRQPHEVFIFCSVRLPAVLLFDRGHWQVDVLDFVAGPPPYEESSAALYTRTCHPGEDWSADGFAARHGYHEQDSEQEITISRPEDIFRYAH